MKIAAIAVTKNGCMIGGKIQKNLGCDLYIPGRFLKPVDQNRRSKSGRTFQIEGNFIDFVHNIFNKYEGIVFVTAAGIAVRAIAGVLRGKRVDPAVVVVDEKGNFSVSLLSGHLGGANDLARTVAKILGATPVITTASDVSGFEGIDVMAKRLGLYVENFAELKKISSCLVNGEKVAFVVETGFPVNKIKEKFKGAKAVFCNEVPADAAACVYITDFNIKPPGIPHVILRPRRTVLGVGAKRGAACEETLMLAKSALGKLNLSQNSVAYISTIDIKRGEECIEKLAQYFNAPLQFYSIKNLAEVENQFPMSSFVKETVGVGSVARPSGYLASGCGEELGYFRGAGVTLAVYKKAFISAERQ